MTRKIYRAFCKRYAVQVSINGGSRLISFLPCNPVSGMNSMYISDDTDVQKALEESSSFNIGFFLEKSILIEDSKSIVPATQTFVIKKEYTPEATDTTDAENPVGPEAEPEATEQAKEGDNSFPDVTNAQSAKIIMLGLFPEENTEIAELRKADEIRQFANKKGIVFPNWL